MTRTWEVATEQNCVLGFFVSTSLLRASRASSSRARVELEIISIMLSTLRANVELVPVVGWPNLLRMLKYLDLCQESL